jgi:hypothetical protein
MSIQRMGFMPYIEADPSLLWGYMAPREDTVMRSIKCAHVSLIAGLALGMVALWAGATPIGAVGDLTMGGWTDCLTQEDVRVAATYWDCDPCDGTVLRYCYEGAPFGAPPCSGGMVTVVVAASAGATPHATGRASCYGNEWCTYIYNGDCY